jgi:pimeloyl-ACP methyl ester carboxylesterase
MSSANPGQPGNPSEIAEFEVSVPGGKIAASRSGLGAPVLILHGGPGLSDYTTPLAAELDDAFRVIRFQQRGLKPSTASGPFGIDRHVADAIAVLDAASADRAYVIGHSWGGHLAMHLAARHQDRLLGLVLVDPLGAVPDGDAGDLDRILTERTPPELAARAQELDQRAMAGKGTAQDALLRTRQGPANAAAERVGGVLRRNVRVNPLALRAQDPRAVPAHGDSANALRAGRGQPDPSRARHSIGRAHPWRPLPD